MPNGEVKIDEQEQVEDKNEIVDDTDSEGLKDELQSKVDE